MSWFEANEHCKNRGAHLVEINSEEENAAIVEEIINGGQEEKNSYFWIGLTDSNKEGTWKLASNGAEATFLNWDGSFSNNPEPNNHDGNEHCAYIRSGGCLEWDKSGWADIDCSKTMVAVQCYLRLEVLQFSMNALCEFEAETGEYIDKDNVLRILFNRWQQSSKEDSSGHIRKHCCGSLSSGFQRHRTLHLQAAKSKKSC